MKKQIPRGLPLILLALLLCTWMACKKDPLPPYTGPQPIDYTVLPPATQTGAGTFGCLVDGDVWVPRVELFVPTYDKLFNFFEYSNGGGGLSAKILTSTQNDYLSLSFSPNNFMLSKHLPTSDSLYPYRVWLWFRFGDSGDYFEPIYEQPDSSNFFKVTYLDTSKNIISGEFNFTLYNQVGNEIRLTNGRFDMKYNPQ
jgi:hypothetical protein